MTELANQVCEACKAGTPLLTDAELAELMPQLAHWRVDQVNGVKRLVKTYTFPNFVSAMDFAHQVADLAEEHNHHPKLCVEWGKVEVSWWTHKISGIHHNDAVLAAKTDTLVK